MTPQPLRYVVLRHEGIPDPHYDLMLELSPGAALTTWRSNVWPLRALTPLTPLADHRREYLAYEGPVSGGRGTVTRVAGGEYELIHRGRVMLIVRLPGLEPDEWLISDSPRGSVAVPATENAGRDGTPA
jgi:hypothetical protein